jgi:hypothetical protein
VATLPVKAHSDKRPRGVSGWSFKQIICRCSNLRRQHVKCACDLR